MESAYTLANKELEEIRERNQALSDSRHHEVMLKAPELSEIETALSQYGSRLLGCVLNKGEGFEEIKESIRALRRQKAELLTKNGYATDYLDDIYNCSICGDTGYIDGKRCSCLKKLIMQKIGANSNLTEQMRSHRFENFDFSLFANQQKDTEKVLKIMRIVCERSMEYAESFDTTGKNLLMIGNAGTGKTFVSSCIANRALERGKSVYYQTAFKLFDIFEKSKFDKNSDEDFADTIKYIYEVDLLIIDDLGTEFVTQYTTAIFFDLINSRNLAKKSTIISTNLSFEDISKIYSQRIASRFTGDYNIMQTVGEDLRRLKQGYRN